MHNKTLTFTLLLGMVLGLAQPAAAKVFLCENPATGEKTFTDHACPSAAQGRKVHVVPVNFGGRKQPAPGRNSEVWNSDRDKGISGRDRGERHIQAAKSANSTLSEY